MWVAGSVRLTALIRLFVARIEIPSLEAAINRMAADLDNGRDGPIFSQSRQLSFPVSENISRPFFAARVGPLPETAGWAPKGRHLENLAPRMHGIE